jgi:tRNA(fMet)-specific endonuclease VapC
MSFLLDTNTCIYYLNQSHPGVVRRLAAAGPEEVAVSSLTVAELYFGAARSARPEANRGVLAAFLRELRSIPFDDRCGERFGAIRAERLATGRPVPDFDLAIAATALAHGLTLVSADRRHLSALPGLVVEDWTVEPGAG